MSHVLSSVAWPYANGPRHIGHVAGFGVPSDVFSRYMRMAGHQVLMVSGSDEHGTPILVQADKAGMSAQEFIDVNHRLIVEDLTALGVSYDLYTRTTTANHDHVVQQMFLACHRNGYMIEQTQKVAISPSTGRTLPDRYIEGTCPICKYPEARGDQCDNCGNQLDPVDLIDPHSKINGEAPEFTDTQHFFLDLPALADALSEWLDGREASGLWRPNVIKFSQNILEEIRPRAMTRDIDWGITIPLPGWEENPTKKLYVWFDAVIGYLSASVEWARRRGEPERWRDWWNDPEALTYYFMGKDNITFHAQIWPAEMLAQNGAGTRGGEQGPFGELNLPTEVVSSEFLTMEGRQFSTSRSIVIYVRDVLERYQPDALRYFLSAAAPETADSDFSWPEFVKRTNNELVAGWGNLVNRTASMIAKNFGEIPAAGDLEDVDRALLGQIAEGFTNVGRLIATHKQKAGLAEAMRLVGEANAYVSTTEPFKLKGEDQRARLATVLHVLAQAVVDLNTLLSPFLPHSSNAVHAALGGTGQFMPMPHVEEVSDLDEPQRPAYPIITGDYAGMPPWESRPVTVGAPVAKPTPIFTKLDTAIIDEERRRLGLVDEDGNEVSADGSVAGENGEGSGDDGDGTAPTGGGPGA
ncbi:methionine--tRNA ligase [Ornithinimicrobium murale]|uniref:methionine--tRNA ligase n=1 Tax=Ornithinimicrobium murale TaxID=1050153 RepID=UPI000E0D71F6|nr:methionine--tRNA ligase [Ornithinimicrobium murale]